MSKFKTFQDLFKRYRRPGDLVFAVAFMGFAVFLLANLDSQTKWVPRTKLTAQPAFWPSVSLGAMSLFAGLHLLSSYWSPKLEGRWTEVAFWLRSLEYAAWFMIYVFAVPVLGYLLGSVLFALFLSFRLGFRSWATLGGSVTMALCVVVLFKVFLRVNVPGGQIYEYLPTGLRAFMLTYF